MNHVKLMFAVELAEMLSADMQKEGLCGRTLTLKLKTASFEVLMVTDDLTLFSLNDTGREQFSLFVTSI